MTNREIYTIADRLGMVKSECECACSEMYAAHEDDEAFEETSKDLVSVMNFVDELFINNDQETIKKLLTAIIYENSKEPK